MNEKFKQTIATEEISIREAIKKLNENGLQIIIVVDREGILRGTVTDGDVRRAILNNLSLNEPITRIMNRTPKFVYLGQEHNAQNLMLKHNIKTVPIVDQTQRVVDIIMVNYYLGAKEDRKLYTPKSNYVFIMAGGKGTRLDPFTKILPKPLIPIGDKPIIEVIMSNFKKHGFNNFIISLNYKAEMIKLYFSDNPDGYNISYVEEKEFLGTAGSLQLAKESLKEAFIVSNCDVILDVDFEDLLNHHKKCGNTATIVGAVKNMQIPYGVIEAEDGTLVQMIEKPEYDFVINSGVYVLEPAITNLFQEGQPIDMPNLLLQAKENGYKIGVYPVSSKWFDVGQWDEYRRTLDFFKKADEA